MTPGRVANWWTVGRLLVTGSAALSVALVATVSGPVLTDELEVAEQSRQRHAAVEEVAARAADPATVEASAAHLGQLRTRIPTTLDSETVVATLTAAATAAGVAWNGGHVGARERRTVPVAGARLDVEAVPVSLSVTGSVAEVGKFLSAVGQAPRLMTVQQVAIDDGAQDELAAGTVRADVEVVAYAVADEEVSR